ncbi:putative retroelement pol polyprotein [Cucumis melo var. makuwa]|uniref:Putative retroelement pol polyprotein n=1 Tax=Cucumis melo var. makuwa TaxID=1194695 RepID=A0A5D3E1A6_CUCMM|nr:putative retroelement pol polyprotein [Cucumis melo var. makuwa]
MKKDIKKYCDECVICRKDKTSALSLVGLLMPLEIHDAIWSDVSMDFIDGLPKSGGWKVILAAEVVNKSVEAYLRCFYGEKPKEWSQWLHWAEYWYNTTYHGSIGITPCHTIYGRLHPPLIQYEDIETPNSTLDQQLKDRDVILGALKEHLLYRQVSLSRKCNEKLLPKCFGPYKILENIWGIGNLEQVQQLDPYVNENHEWITQPDEVYGYRKNQAIKEWEVLVNWKGLPPHKATWEDCADFKHQFPKFPLVKVGLEEESDARPPILFTYNRRNKKNNEANKEATRRSREESKEVGDH